MASVGQKYWIVAVSHEEILSAIWKKKQKKKEQSASSEWYYLNISMNQGTSQKISLSL